MTWTIPDPLPLQQSPGWERTFEQWLAKLGALVPGGLSLDQIGADETFIAFQDGVPAEHYAILLQAPRPPRRLFT